MESALDGLAVVDFSSGLAGALTTMVLGDFGADVVKVEPPEGDPDRGAPAFAQWHRGKRSLVADLASPEGRDRARHLALAADVVVESWRPGEAEGFGLGYADLAAARPDLVYCSMTGFGPRGPLAGIKGYEAVVAAKAGLMAGGGDRPRYPALRKASFGAAQAALQGVLAALFVRGNTGVGQKVETSLVQGLTAYDLYSWIDAQLAPEFAQHLGAPTTYSPLQGMHTFTGDGKWLQFANFRPHLLRAFLEAIDLTEWHAEALARGETPEVIADTVRRRLHERSLAEWMAIFEQSNDIGVEPVRTPAEAMDHPQVLCNSHAIDLDDPHVGPTRQIGPLVHLAKTPAQPKAGAPSLGADTANASFARRLGGLGSNPLPATPLAGVTVVELAWVSAAPFGTALLADLGARVIKIENLEGDPHRYQGPIPEWAGLKGLQGKESIALDYRTPKGREVLDRIIARADMVMRNFRQAASVQTGIDYDRLASVNPDLVYLYAADYGAEGPYSLRPAFDPTMAVAAGMRAYQLGWDHALSGGGSITYEEGLAQLEGLAAQGVQGGGADPTSALVVGTAMLLGLVARQRTGASQFLQSTMLNSSAYLVSEAFFTHGGTTVDPTHDENGLHALYRLYPTSDSWVFLAAPTPSEWADLTAALDEVTAKRWGLTDDARFTTPADRASNDGLLAAALGDILASLPAAEWEQQLLARGVTCVEVSEVPLSQFDISSPTAVDNGFSPRSITTCSVATSATDPWSPSRRRPGRPGRQPWWVSTPGASWPSWATATPRSPSCEPKASSAGPSAEAVRPWRPGMPDGNPRQLEPATLQWR